MGSKCRCELRVVHMRTPSLACPCPPPSAARLGHFAGPRLPRLPRDNAQGGWVRDAPLYKVRGRVRGPPVAVAGDSRDGTGGGGGNAFRPLRLAPQVSLPASHNTHTNKGWLACIHRHRHPSSALHPSYAPRHARRLVPLASPPRSAAPRAWPCPEPSPGVSWGNAAPTAGPPGHARAP